MSWEEPTEVRVVHEEYTVDSPGVSPSIDSSQIESAEQRLLSRQREAEASL